MDPLNFFLNKVTLNDSESEKLCRSAKPSSFAGFLISIPLGYIFILSLMLSLDLGPLNWLCFVVLIALSSVSLLFALTSRSQKSKNILTATAILLLAFNCLINAVRLRYLIENESVEFQSSIKPGGPAKSEIELISLFAEYSLRARFTAERLTNYIGGILVFFPLAYSTLEYYPKSSTAIMVVIMYSSIPFSMMRISNTSHIVNLMLIVSAIVVFFISIKMKNLKMFNDLIARNERLEKIFIFYKDWIKNLNANYILIKGYSAVFENVKMLNTQARIDSFYNRAVVSSSEAKGVQEGWTLLDLVHSCSEINTSGRFKRIAKLLVDDEADPKYFECYLRTYEEGFSELILNDTTSTALKEQQDLKEKLSKIAFAQIAHEFKTPINTLVVLMDRLVEMDSSKNLFDVRKNLEVLKGLARYIIYLVGDINSYCKSKDVKDNLEREVSLNDLFNFCATVMKALMEVEGNKKVEAISHNSLEKREITLLIDGERLKQVILNLISNAVKFTNKGFVKLSCGQEMDTDKIVFSVEDSGKGMDTETLKAVDKGSLAFKARNLNNEAGTGLGIGICRQICNENKFEFNMQSKLKKGTIISIKLNERMLVRECDSLESTVIYTSGMWLEKEECEVKVENNAPITQIQLIQNNICFSGPRDVPVGEAIVIVDDVSHLRSSIRSMLGKIGEKKGKEWNFIEACDGAEAIYQIVRCAQEGVDVSLMVVDQNMEYVQGSQTVGILQEMMDNKRIESFPCFSFTGLEGCIDENEECKYDKVLPKPVSEADLFSALEECNLI